MLSLIEHLMDERTWWMCGLHVSRERMLGWAVLPWWVLFVVSYVAGVALGPLPVLGKAIAGSNYWLADYLLMQFCLAVAIRLELWLRQPLPLTSGRRWRAFAYMTLLMVPVLLSVNSIYKNAGGLPMQVPVALAIARYLPSEPAIWVLLICSTPILLWKWLLRAFARTELQFNRPTVST